MVAVIASGSTGLKLAWNTDLDNACDRVLAIQDQHGRADSWAPDVGEVDRLAVGLEAIELDANQNKHTDGVTFGSNTLISASNPFTAPMVGEEILIEGFGRRTIATFVGVNEVTFSGSTIAAGPTRTFVVPLGVDGGARELEGTAGYPFAARFVDSTELKSTINWLVGRKRQG